MTNDGETPPDAERGPTSPRTQAREAMDRARQSARDRGASSPRSAKQAARERRAKRNEADPRPYGAGREPRSIEDQIARVIEDAGWSENLELAAVTARWAEVVGSAIAEHTAHVEFTDGVLTVTATSTAWATELGLLATRIRDRLNESAGKNLVTEVRAVGPTGRSWKKGQRSVRGRGPRDTYG